jgi:hypothetical protein
MELTPWTSPFTLTPRISQKTKPLPIHLDSSHDRICMAFIDPFAISPGAPKDASCASEEKVLVDLQELFLPKVFLVENVSAEDLCCDAASQIFQRLASETSLDGGIVLVNR